MNIDSFVAIGLALIPCIYAVKQNRFFFAISFFTILLLGVIQTEFLLIIEAYEISNLFRFEFSKDDLIYTRLVFEIINCIGIFFLYIIPKKNQENIKSHIQLTSNFQGIIFSITTLVIIIYTIVISLDTIETGRPYFQGIGIAIGLLVPFALALILLTNNAVFRIVGFFGFLNIFYFSRLFAIFFIMIIVIYKIKLSLLKVPSLKILIPTISILILIFLIIGQFKHLIGNNVSWRDAILLTLNLNDWLIRMPTYSDMTNLDKLNLGIFNNYIFGIELGAEVADCLYRNNISINNLLGTMNDVYSSLFPSFLRHQLDFDLRDISCNVAVIKSPLVDLIRAFGYLGVIIFPIIFWTYIRICEMKVNSSNSSFQIFYICIFGVYSIFLIRGSIGAFVSFSIALFCAILIIRIVGKKNVKKI